MTIIAELNSGYRVLLDNKSERCSNEHRIQKIGASYDLTKEECLKKCDAREECKYAFWTDQLCALYNSCQKRRLIDMPRYIGSVYEKGKSYYFWSLSIDYIKYRI